MPQVMPRQAAHSLIEYVTDHLGHEHAADGRFATTGGSAAPSAPDSTPDDLAALPPKLAARVKSLLRTSTDMVKRVVLEVAYRTPQILDLWTSVFDSPDDFKKIGYNPAFAGTGPRTGDPMKDTIGIPTHMAANLLSKVVPAVVTWVKNKLRGAVPTNASRYAEGDDLWALADFVVAVMTAAWEPFGAEFPMSVEDVMEAMNDAPPPDAPVEYDEVQDEWGHPLPPDAQPAPPEFELAFDWGDPPHPGTGGVTPTPELGGLPAVGGRLGSGAHRVEEKLTGGMSRPPAPPVDVNGLVNEIGRLKANRNDPDEFLQAFANYVQMLSPDEQNALFDLYGVDPMGGAEHLAAEAWSAIEKGAVPDAGTGTTPTASASELPFEPPDLEELRTPERDILANAAVDFETDADTGINGAKFLNFVDGGVGVYKAQAKEQDERWGVPKGGLFRREVASSLIADVLGFGDLVPPTTFRTDHTDGPGSVMQFVNGSVKAKELPRSTRHGSDEDATRAAVFDYLIGHADRHYGNWMVGDRVEGLADSGQPRKIFLIDNGYSFPESYSKNDYGNVDFWRHAKTLWPNVPPEVAEWGPSWPEVERVLRATGIGNDAVGLTKQRFDALIAGAGKPFMHLPASMYEKPLEPLKFHVT